MKLTLANIKELKRNSNSPLLKRVCNYVIDRWSEYDDKKHIPCASTNSTRKKSTAFCTTQWTVLDFTLLRSYSATSGTRKIRLRRMTSIRTCWRGSVSKKHSETSLTTLKH